MTHPQYIFTAKLTGFCMTLVMFFSGAPLPIFPDNRELSERAGVYAYILDTNKAHSPHVDSLTASDSRPACNFPLERAPGLPLAETYTYVRNIHNVTARCQENIGNHIIPTVTWSRQTNREALV